jgi:hypothetical protein
MQSTTPSFLPYRCLTVGSFSCISTEFAFHLYWPPFTGPTATTRKTERALPPKILPFYQTTQNMAFRNMSIVACIPGGDTRCAYTVIPHERRHSFQWHRMMMSQWQRRERKITWHRNCASRVWIHPRIMRPTLVGGVCSIILINDLTGALKNAMTNTILIIYAASCRADTNNCPKSNTKKVTCNIWNVCCIWSDSIPHGVSPSSTEVDPDNTAVYSYLLNVSQIMHPTPSQNDETITRRLQLVQSFVGICHRQQNLRTIPYKH